MVVDLGTGTGQSVLRAARRDPDALFVGIDPDAAALREASHAAARAERRGGLPNVVFMVDAAETLPGPLAGRADLVTIALPWGSLLRGLLTADAALLDAVTALLKTGGELELLLSTAPTDGAPILLSSEGDAHALACAYESAGLAALECRAATADDVARLSSSWGRRLGIPRRRTGWILRLGKGPERGRGTSRRTPASHRRQQRRFWSQESGNPMKHSRTALTLCLALAATLTFVACSAAAASAPNADSASRALDQPPADNPPDGGGSDPNDGDGKTDPGNPGDPVAPGTGGDEPIVAPPITEPPVDLPLPDGGATVVQPVPGIVDATAHAWDHIDVAADGRTITVYYWGGVDSCYGLDRVDTTFDDGVLHVTVFEGRLGDLPADTACIEIALLKSVTITLDQPIIAPSE